MEIIVLTLFGISLLGCILLDLSVLYALFFGFFLFFSYGLGKHFSLKQMACMSIDGVKTVKNILLTFVLIGMLTALWRAAGTIPVIICYTSGLIRPSVFLLVSFLLNCAVSFLTGTSFGTAATIGVICMTMGATMQINPILAGGSVISGIFFGDRCSPVSTSALLVCELTKTDIYQNIRRMMAYAAVPFGVTCVVYTLLGLRNTGNQGSMDVWTIFSRGFHLHWAALLPAAVILILSLFRIKVKATMAVSILTAMAVCLLIQQMPPGEVFRLLIFGYRSQNQEIAAMLNGGGIVSMIKVSTIVCLSSSYAGIFSGTHMLDKIQEKIAEIGNYMPAFGGIMGVSIFTSAISCNQTLAIMLTDQLCRTLEPDGQKRAIALEDAPVIIAPMIPWSIAGAVPIAAIGASSMCLFAACYLYLIPIWHLIYTLIKEKRGNAR